ncbi:DUF4236 domain-containing protein [Rheinheimera oceanensis]|uniref:DUF4236 domain-containing protein n=1 Tax=Rheinheimera oceanensis TaxID=2817449 RepID=UPI001BFE59C0|nr:DUF4236 domain-containing protein [Rheinheimera oceanensis]
MFKRRRSIKLAKGVKLNLGKSGISSISVGGKGLTLNGSRKGLKATASIKGTGLSSSSYLIKNSSQNTNSTDRPQHEPSKFERWLLFIVFCVFIYWLIWL